MYELIKAVHITAVIVWMGATLGALVVLGVASPSDALARRLRALMSLGLVATWLAGLALASEGGWFQFRWLHVKLVLVLVLTATHGMISGRLRRAVAGAASASVAATVVFVAATVAVIFAIAAVVVIKPGLAGTT